MKNLMLCLSLFATSIAWGQGLQKGLLTQKDLLVHSEAVAYLLSSWRYDADGKAVPGTVVEKSNLVDIGDHQELFFVTVKNGDRSLCAVAKVQDWQTQLKISEIVECKNIHLGMDNPDEPATN